METRAQATPLGRCDGARRDAILAVAESHFLTHGFSGTSMSDIRAEAGGSKSTLWNYFSSKEDLFSAVLSEATSRIVDRITLMAQDEGDARSSLESFCLGYVTEMCSDKSIALHRLVIGEVHRFPEIGQTFFKDAVEKVWRDVAAFLTRILPSNQEIARDPIAAAELLTSLCHGPSFVRFLYGVVGLPTSETIRTDVENAVEAFLRAHPA